MTKEKLKSRGIRFSDSEWHELEKIAVKEAQINKDKRSVTASYMVRVAVNNLIDAYRNNKNKPVVPESEIILNKINKLTSDYK